MGDDCHDVMVGASGGCCSGDPVECGNAGFGVLHFLPGGGMFVERIVTGESCNMWPSSHEVSEFDKIMTQRHHDMSVKADGISMRH